MNKIIVVTLLFTISLYGMEEGTNTSIIIGNNRQQSTTPRNIDRGHITDLDMEQDSTNSALYRALIRWVMGVPDWSDNSDQSHHSES